MNAETTNDPIDEAAAPDWSGIDREILCPLCDYNLRGLIEPRCPECGHRFEWNQVLVQGDPIHPFLYEHQIHRPTWAFFTTLRRSVFPKSFWRTVLPVHRPVLGRLARYWGLLLLPGLGCFLFLFVLAFPQQQAFLDARRRQLSNQFNSPFYPVQQLVQTYGSVQAAIDQYAPPATAWNTLRWTWQNERSFAQHLIPVFEVALFWPWLTFASLLIFRFSMRQARIKRGHVLRCVIYSQDMLLVVLPLWLLVVHAIPDFVTSGLIVDPAIIPFMFQSPLLLLPPMLLLTTWRLWMSYRHYLRFPHALATAVASQTIVGLALLKWWIM